MSKVTLEQARQAKTKLARALGGVPQVSGVGIAKADSDYAVRVNLSEDLAAGMPASVDGVPIQYAVVGKISKRPAG